MTNQKFRCFFYFSAFFLLTLNYWLTKYGLPTRSHILSICHNQPSTLFTFQGQKVVIDFFLCALIYPSLFTFMLILIETWLSKQHTNLYLRFALRYLPIFLILFSSLHFYLHSHWIEWLIELVLIFLFYSISPSFCQTRKKVLPIL